MLPLPPSFGIVNIDTKTTASLSICEINSKETVNHIISKASSKIFKKEDNKLEKLTSLNQNPEELCSLEFNEEKKNEELNKINTTLSMKNKSLSLRSLLRTYSTIPSTSSSLSAKKNDIKYNNDNDNENENNEENKPLPNLFNKPSEKSSSISLNTESINIPTSLKALKNSNSIIQHVPYENYINLPFHRSKIFVKKRNFSK